MPEKGGFSYVGFSNFADQLRRVARNRKGASSSDPPLGQRGLVRMDEGAFAGCVVKSAPKGVAIGEGQKLSRCEGSAGGEGHKMKAAARAAHRRRPR